MQYVGFFAQTYKTKNNTDGTIPFARSQKSHKHIISKRFSGLKTCSNNS